MYETHWQFAAKFWAEYASFPPSAIYNVDETAVYFDMPPNKMLALRGRKGSAKVKRTQKHSGRMTAVITARADGKKLPILFIIRAMPGGPVEKEELRTYPSGHVYTVQENGWMDLTVWAFYVRELLRYEIESPSVLMLDNFDAHVSEKGLEVVAETTSARVCQLPAKSTPVCQPLDVGVMGPLKKKITAMWVAETSSPTCRATDECDHCGMVEECCCWDNCFCWKECMCSEDCLCIDSCVCSVGDEHGLLSEDNSSVQQPIRSKKISSTMSAAVQKRRATVERTIQAWEDLAADVIVKSFDKAIPKNPMVVV